MPWTAPGDPERSWRWWPAPGCPRQRGQTTFTVIVTVHGSGAAEGQVTEDSADVLQPFDLAWIMHGPILGCPDYQTQTFLVIGARQNLSVHYPG
jgi:hypothetical protein